MNLDMHLQLLAQAGASRVYAKILRKNNNSKNQFYLSSNMEITNLLPLGEIQPDPKNPERLKAPLTFRWVLDDGSESSAHKAQLILYPQYPEVRLSSLLVGTKGAPGEIIRNAVEGRILFFGIRPDGAILGRAASETSAAAAEVLARQSEFPQNGVFLELPVPGLVDGRRILIAELHRIYRAGWLPSRRLSKDGDFVECNAQNCGGYTLEAELGIPANGRPDPDFNGWEVKQYAVKNVLVPRASGPVTLMTPEPTLGVYANGGVIEFIRRFGYSDRKGRADRINFGGVHRAGVQSPLTGLTLQFEGFDAVNGKITDARGGLRLMAQDGTVAAGWEFASLLTHWARKHALAAYVPCEKRVAVTLEYRYGSVIDLGEGTDFSRFLQAMSKGQVYYDPGIKLENASSKAARVKRRSQFRIRHEHLPNLYRAFDKFNIS